MLGDVKVECREQLRTPNYLPNRLGVVYTTGAMRKQKLTPTTKTIDELYQLYQEGRLDLSADYQRNSVWPPKARAYLVDTVLMDRPIPMLFVARVRDSNKNKIKYRVIDGQQRLRAVFSYFENKFGAGESKSLEISGKRYKKLSEDFKEQFVGYSFVIMEMAGYSDEELREIFARINKYVVRLNPQELRDAEQPGVFKNFIDNLSQDEIWNTLKLFTKNDRARKRDKEFVAELVLLFLDGPQDKKGSLALYYAADAEQFEGTDEISTSILKAANIAVKLTDSPELKTLRKLPAFYALMGAIHSHIQIEEVNLEADLVSENIKEKLKILASIQDELLKEKEKSTVMNSEKYVDLALKLNLALSRQTDNVRPRLNAIEVFSAIINEALFLTVES